MRIPACNYKEAAEAACLTMFEMITTCAPSYRNQAQFILVDEKFKSAYGSSTGTQHAHHDFPGGLPIHTLEVMKIAQRTALFSNEISMEVILLSALYHDYGKIFDYDNEGHKLPHAKLIHHPVASYHQWMICANYQVSLDITMRVGHAILAHHGRVEWGSAVEMQTPEAHILHYADMLSSKWGKDR